MRTASFLNLKKAYTTWRFESSVNKDQTNLQMVLTSVKIIMLFFFTPTDLLMKDTLRFV